VYDLLLLELPRDILNVRLKTGEFGILYDLLLLLWETVSAKMRRIRSIHSENGPIEDCTITE
jgi:hypothetical protein